MKHSDQNEFHRLIEESQALQEKWDAVILGMGLNMATIRETLSHLMQTHQVPPSIKEEIESVLQNCTKRFETNRKSALQNMKGTVIEEKHSLHSNKQII